MQLLLVRHGQPVTEVHTDGSFANPSLSHIGQQQADLAGKWLAELGVQRVYASPMARALQTAEPIAAAAQLGSDAIVVREGLTEFDSRSSSYVPMEVMKRTNRARWDELASGTFNADDAAGVQAWVEQAVAAIEQIVADHAGERVAVACHGGVVNAYLAHCLDFDTERFLRFDVDYTSVTRVMASGQGHRSVLSINERSHLRGYPELTLGM